MSLPALVTGGAETVTLMFLAGSAASKAGSIFSRPYFNIGVKHKMATIGHKFKIAQLVIKSIAINVVNNFILFQLSTKMLFHNPTVLVCPIFSARADFDSDIFQGAASPNSFGEQGKGTRVVHAPHSNTGAPPFGFRVSGNVETIFTLFWVIVGIAIRSFYWCNRLATNATWFVRQSLHGNDYIPTQSKKQVIYGGAI